MFGKSWVVLMGISMILISGCGSDDNSKDVDSRNVLVTWDPPAYRLDGEILSSSDIAAYEISYVAPDGQSHSYRTIDSQPFVEVDVALQGVYQVQVATIDAQGQTGPMSESHSFEL